MPLQYETCRMRAMDFPVASLNILSNTKIFNQFVELSRASSCSNAYPIHATWLSIPICLHKSSTRRSRQVIILLKLIHVSCHLIIDFFFKFFFRSIFPLLGPFRMQKTIIFALSNYPH